MIPETMKEYIFNETGAPIIITSNAQLEEYVVSLLELDRQGNLTTAERNFAELLTLLIQEYVEGYHCIRLASSADVLQELLLADDPSQES